MAKNTTLFEAHPQTFFFSYFHPVNVYISGKFLGCGLATLKIAAGYCTDISQQPKWKKKFREVLFQMPPCWKHFMRATWTDRPRRFAWSRTGACPVDGQHTFFRPALIPGLDCLACCALSAYSTYTFQLWLSVLYVHPSLVANLFSSV